MPKHSISRRPAVEERLRPSPNFALCWSFDGRPFVAKEVEPYTQYWLNERNRVLLGLFGTPRGATFEQAVATYLQTTGRQETPALVRQLRKDVAQMREAGVLVSGADDTSRYSAEMVADYLRHRPFPRQVTQVMVEAGRIGAHSAVLDLAGGPGDLAVQLAHVSSQVSMMELSKGFAAAAADRAKAQGVPLSVIHDSCNRLMFHDGAYDVISVAGALHWLDDVLVCRGVCRLLRPGGSFFVVMGAMELADDHPLAYVLGRHSILGHKDSAPFAAQMRALQRRLGLLLEALDASDAQRAEPAPHSLAGTEDGEGPAAAAGPIVPVGVHLFRQHRPFGPGFARGFLSPRHIEATGQSLQDFWRDLDQRCHGVPAQRMRGYADWAVLQFQRGGVRARPLALRGHPVQVFDDLDLPL